MDEKIKRKQIAVYFTHALLSSVIAGSCLLAAILSFAVFSIVMSGNILAPFSGRALGVICAALIPLLFLVSYILHVLNSMPEDHEIDAWFKEETETLKKKALQLLGVEGKVLLAEPVVIFKPVMWKAKEINEENINKKKGKDGLLRFSAWKFMILEFTEKRLGCYIAMYDFIKGETTKETTEEFYYTDIVRVATEQEKVVLLGGDEVTLEQLVIKVSSGDSVGLRDITMLYETEKNKVIPTPKLEEAVTSIRKILEEKKQ